MTVSEHRIIYANTHSPHQRALTDCCDCLRKIQQGNWTVSKSLILWLQQTRSEVQGYLVVFLFLFQNGLKDHFKEHLSVWLEILFQFQLTATQEGKHTILRTFRMFLSAITLLIPTAILFWHEKSRQIWIMHSWADEMLMSPSSLILVLLSLYKAKSSRMRRPESSERTRVWFQPEAVCDPEQHVGGFVFFS